MSYKDGAAAINLEMPERIPRTEYSAESHWELVKAVTGINVKTNSDLLLKSQARRAFMKAWSYDFCWSTLIGGDEFGTNRSRMGHAIYATDGIDYDARQSKLYKDPEDAFDFDPWILYGYKDKKELVQRFNAHYKANCEDFSDAVNMTGIYVSCMSGLIDIFGWETLLGAAGLDAKGFGEVTNRYACWIEQYFQALALCDAPVVMIHDDIVWTGGAFIHPDWYRQFIFPNYKRLFRPLIENSKKIIFTSDGTYTDFIDDIVQ